MGNDEEGEVFTGYAGWRFDPRVTIRREGWSIYLNAAAYNALGRPPRVQLGTDDGPRHIHIIAAHEQTPHSTAVCHVKDADRHYFAGRAFTQHLDIDTSISRRYHVSGQDGRLVIDLHGTFADATGPRRKKPANEE